MKLCSCFTTVLGFGVAIKKQVEILPVLEIFFLIIEGDIGLG